MARQRRMVRAALAGCSLVVALLALAAYANSLANGFVWDDPIILDRQLVAFHSAADVLIPPAGIPQFSPDYYRPLVIASYLFDRAVGRGSAVVYHASVVLAHVLVSALVCLLAFRLAAGEAARLVAAIVAGVAFAVHPVHTESVAWLAGRSDVLATLFVLAALLFLIGGWPTAGSHSERVQRQNNGGGGSPGEAGKGASVWRNMPAWLRSVTGGGLLLVAMTAKETALAAYPLLILYDGLRAWQRPFPLRRPRWWLIRYSGPVGAAAIYFALRLAALGVSFGGAPAPSGRGVSWVDVLAAVGVYLSKLVWPLPLNAYIDTLPSSSTSIALTLAAIGATLLVCGWLLRRGESTLVFLVAWVWITLLPSLVILWKIPESPVAERYLYLPSVGFCLLLGETARRFMGATWSQGWPRTGVRLVLGVLALAALGKTVARNRIWHDNVALWRDTAEKSRVSGLPLRSLATAYLASDDLRAAEETFRRSLGMHNSRRGLQIIHNNLGTLAMRRGDSGAAVRAFRRALEAAPGAPDTLFNLGLALFERSGQTAAGAREALPYYRKALEQSPFDADVHVALGQALLASGKPGEAVAYLRKALRLGVRPGTRASVEAALKRLGGR